MVSVLPRRSMRGVRKTVPRSRITKPDMSADQKPVAETFLALSTSFWPSLRLMMLPLP